MRSLLIILQLCLLAAGYGVYLNQWVEPSVFPFFNLLALGFPIIFILNVILLFFWWLYRWKLAILFTILSLAFIIPLNKIYHLYGEPETQESNFKLLTYNVQYFFADKNGSIVDFLKKENADIIFIQEMGPQPEWIIDNASQDKPYYFQNYNSLGIASKYPILETQKFIMKPYPATFCYADIALPNDTIRFITFYMQSLQIDQNELKNAEVDKQLKNTAIDFSSKVITASKIHEKQIATIRENIKKSPYPVVLAGDMNAVPSSYEYYALQRGKKDAFLFGGKGLGSTFPGMRVPLRLDAIFVPDYIKIKSHRIEKVNYSDHYPVIVDMLIP